MKEEYESIKKKYPKFTCDYDELSNVPKQIFETSVVNAGIELKEAFRLMAIWTISQTEGNVFVYSGNCLIAKWIGSGIYM